MEKLCETMRQYGPLAGRILLASIFVVSGWGKITGFFGTVAYMSARGMPLTEFLAVGAIVVELGGAIALMQSMGYRMVHHHLTKAGKYKLAHGRTLQDIAYNGVFAPGT